MIKIFKIGKHIRERTFFLVVFRRIEKLLNKVVDKVVDFVFFHRFYKLKQETRGMLRVKTYKEIYNQVYNLPDFDILEVGGASGAVGVAVAWAMQDSKKKSKVIVIEGCEGDSRDEIGDKKTNYEILINNFKKFGVDEKIILFPHAITFNNAEKVIKLIEKQKLAAIIHDADGRIDRDFYFFYPILIEEGLIIIDDYSDKNPWKPYKKSTTGFSKKIVYYRLLNQFIEWGLFIKNFTIGVTVFGYKPKKSDFSKFNLDDCNKIIKEIEEERKSIIL